MGGALLIAALAGAAVMTLEMLASRWLGPAFGASLTTWSVLISLTLLAGSLGAWWGAARASRGRYSLSVLLLPAGAYGLALAWGAPALVDALVPVPLTTGLLLATTLIVFAPVFLLGAVLPALAARAGGAPDPGVLLGRLVAASTLGSLVGTLVTALVLIPQCGLFATAVGFSTLLLLAGASGLPMRTACLLLPIAAYASGEPGLTPGTWETAHGRLTFTRHGGAWQLDVNGITQARGTPDLRLPGALLRARTYTELLPWMRPASERALVVGLGGGITGRMLARHGIVVDTFELDPTLVEVVRAELGVPGPVFVGDGRALWRRSEERYDVIVLDAFHGERVPSHLFTQEAFGELEERLTPRGVLCVHAILPLEHRLTDALHATLAAVFPRVRLVRTAAGAGFQDLYFFASAGPLQVPPHPDLRGAGWLGNEFVELAASGALVLTDERSLLSRWHRAVAAEHRRRSRP